MTAEVSSTNSIHQSYSDRFVLYGDFKAQPQIAEDLFFISANHTYTFFIISIIGFFSYFRNKKFKVVVIYLFSLSILLETFHLIIPQRAFQTVDLAGNIFGVLIAYIIILIYKFWRR